MESRVKVEYREKIAIVSLNRGEKYNALDMAMFEAITKTINELKLNRAIRAVILRGEGKGFCAGLDMLSVMKKPLNVPKLLKKEQGNLSNLAQDVGYLWRSVPVPVIAVTHGSCFGGGMQIALGADFRYSTPDCRFSIMEAKWGLIPDMSLSVTLRELTRIDVAKELTMSGRVFEASEALELGLISKISDDPFQEALAFAHSLTKRSPDAVMYAKSLFNETWLSDEASALDCETRYQKRLLGRWNHLVATSRNFFKSPLGYKKRDKS
ncbi:crotonase/enoyl-CoA hydratase family protein [Psychrobium sp. 1_MG-2023]|uniref:crotonase/enoyl-CoA hydratase family protein n=1 Tax=Psychrobium sp. 1_MG-2023 TaxID=3062624 RepID=UPI000C33AE0D|nr:crotonase/enoyl-CoA hydratase family protein [Psychrobium sp. 1_MG-2023]MDP2562027.1 crotonase/enoyl-CoA hydratase family protein [Psychrobium sp. 1_MG-2023]PKF58514.1 enoyl-CoA hydratase [Alteromonadales bacterium alter-6D02]